MAGTVSSQPLASTSFRMRSPWCAERLSITTTCPGRSFGASTSSHIDLEDGGGDRSLHRQRWSPTLHVHAGEQGGVRATVARKLGGSALLVPGRRAKRMKFIRAAFLSMLVKNTANE